MCASCIVAYIIALTTLIGLQLISTKLYGWKGLLRASIAQVVLILGGGTLFWNWWDNPTADAKDAILFYEEGIAFALVWQIIPTLVILLGASAAWWREGR